MSTTLTISRCEIRQLEPQKTLVERTPVEERRKLSVNKVPESIQDCTWEDLRGLFFVFDEEDWS